MAATDGDIPDLDLRRQLKSLGEEVGPITDNTRPFLLRKLKRLRNEQTKERSSLRRRTSPGPKSLPATTRNQSPSRKLIGFSSDEEDAGPSHSSTLRESSKLRSRRREAASSDGESLGRSAKTKPSPTRRSNLRQRVPSFIDSVSERTVDSTDDTNGGEFSDQDGQLYHKPRSRSSGITRYLRTVKRGSEESERSESMRSSSYDNGESVTTENTALQERPTGAGDVKTRSFWPSSLKIVLVISAICIGIVLYVALKNHSSKKELLEQLGENILKLSVLNS